MIRILAIVVLAFAASPAFGQSLKPETLARIKPATVYIQAETKGISATGSGFLVKIDGTDGYIVTNNHVIDFEHERIAMGAPPGNGPKAKLTVIFDSGTVKERSAAAKVVASDPDHDLAVLKVSGLKDLPKPLDIANPPELTETMPVFICGYPFGENLSEGKKHPEISIGPGSVSAIRTDDTGRVSTVQINGALNPGNSGGPVVNIDGKLVGVAVRTIRAAGIGQAIPQHEVATMMNGRPGRMTILPGNPDAAEDGPAKFVLTLVDPLGKVKSATAHYRKSLPEMMTPNGKEISIMPGSTTVPLTIADGKATADIVAPPKGRMYVQVMTETVEAKVFTTPTEVTIVVPGPKPGLNRPGERLYTLPGGQTIPPPLREKPKSPEGAVDLGDLNQKPQDYLDKEMAIDALSTCALTESPGGYELAVQTESGKPPSNLRVLLVKDLGLQLNDYGLSDFNNYTFAFRLHGKVVKPTGRSESHTFEIASLAFLDDAGAEVTTLKAEAAPPAGKATLGTVGRFPLAYKGQEVTVDAIVMGTRNAGAGFGLLVKNTNQATILNLEFFTSKDLADRVDSDVPNTGAMVRLTGTVEGIDAKTGIGHLGVTTLDILDDGGRKKKTITGTGKISYPSSAPAEPAKTPTPGTVPAKTAAKPAEAPKAVPATKPDAGSSLPYILGGVGSLVVLAGGIGWFVIRKKKAPAPAAKKYAPRTATAPVAAAPATPAAVVPPKSVSRPAPKPAPPRKANDNPFADLG